MEAGKETATRLRGCFLFEIRSASYFISSIWRERLIAWFSRR
jgi:hypothetical protein